MALKKIIHWLHLWLGIVSGLIVIVVGLTGCCYVFISEIQGLTEPYQKVTVQNRPVLLPSKLMAAAEKQLPGKQAKYVSYQQGKAAYVGVYGKGYSLGFYADPYTGKKLHVKNYLNGTDFFSFALSGHRSLWLPYNIGHPIVDTGVLIFIFLLISGIVLWWPKNWKKANRDKSFKIKWGAKFKRVNYDLHNVLGFYLMLILLILAVTGSVYGFEWFEKGYYWTVSGGRTLPEFKQPLSDTTTNGRMPANALDKLYIRYTGLYPDAEIALFPPEKRSEPIQINVNHQPEKNHDLELLYFDQYTLKPLPGTGLFKKRFSGLSAAGQLGRLNYDLHTGQIWGLPTKILAFGASLICASLPVTGFYIWWGKRKKKPASKRRKKRPPHTGDTLKVVPGAKQI